MDFDDTPRTWNKEEKYLFVQLPPSIREIISRRAKIDSDAVRKSQNECAELRRKLEAIQQKESENAKGKEI